MPPPAAYLTALASSPEALSREEITAAAALWVSTYGTPQLEGPRIKHRGGGPIGKWKVFSQYRHPVSAHGLAALSTFTSIALGDYTIFNDEETWGFRCHGGVHPDFIDACEDIYLLAPTWTMVFVNDYHLAFLAQPRPRAS